MYLVLQELEGTAYLLIEVKRHLSKEANSCRSWLAYWSQKFAFAVTWLQQAQQHGRA